MSNSTTRLNQIVIFCYLCGVNYSFFFSWSLPSGTGVTVYSLHPGVIHTELGRHIFTTLPFWIKIMTVPMMWMIKSPREGAQTSIYCAVEESIATESGLYYRWARSCPDLMVILEVSGSDCKDFFFNFSFPCIITQRLRPQSTGASGHGWRRNQEAVGRQRIHGGSGLKNTSPTCCFQPILMLLSA